jgi:hypothetical protein
MWGSYFDGQSPIAGITDFCAALTVTRAQKPTPGGPGMIDCIV